MILLDYLGIVVLYNVRFDYFDECLKFGESSGVKLLCFY